MENSVGRRDCVEWKALGAEELCGMASVYRWRSMQNGGLCGVEGYMG